MKKLENSSFYLEFFKKTVYFLKKDFVNAKTLLNESIPLIKNHNLKGMCYNNLAIVNWFEYKKFVKAAIHDDKEFEILKENFERCWKNFNHSLACFEGLIMRFRDQKKQEK